MTLALSACPYLAGLAERVASFNPSILFLTKRRFHLLITGELFLISLLSHRIFNLLHTLKLFWLAAHSDNPFS